MGSIRVLSFDVANLIAAGEVVDRPASVLKELLENAIDAGGRNITAEIRGGGVAMVRVTDDGSGMSAEDLPVAIRRHATSKIHDAQDLDRIATLGFRGEALAAIASVSDLRILTKTHGAESGTMLTAECGRVLDISEVGCADGTTVVVENLFARVPARRKFLKKDSTETMACVAVAEKVAMSRPDIAFTLVTDGNSRFSTAGDGKLLNTLYALLGRDFASRLIEIHGERGGLTLEGYIGRPDNARNNRNHQNMFINGRYIKSKTMTAALEKAYVSYMAAERFPVCALFLTIPNAAVDVNVHPAKLEVKFSDERAVFELVYYALRTALESNGSRPELDFGRIAGERGGHPAPGKKAEPTGSTASGAWQEAAFSGRQITLPSSSGAEIPGPNRIRTTGSAVPVSETLRRMRMHMEETGLRDPAPHIGQSSLPEGGWRFGSKTAIETSPVCREMPDAGDASFAGAASEEVADTAKSDESDGSPQAEKSPEGGVQDIGTVCRSTPAGTGVSVAGKSASSVATDSCPSYRIIGEAFRCYIFVETGDELLLIDKHAAHERILFERMLSRQKADGRVASQALLVPIRVLLSAPELAAAVEHRTEYEAVGFSYTQETDAPAVRITAIPNGVDPSDAQSLFASLVSDSVEGTGEASLTEEKRRERLLYQVACKAAIKGGRIYGEEQIDWLVRTLLSLPDITVCPHGRPVAVRMTRQALDRQFDRIM